MSLSNLHPTPSNHHERHQEAHHGGETCRFARFWYWSTEHLANLWGTLGWLVGWKIVLGMIFFVGKSEKSWRWFCRLVGKKTTKRGNMVMEVVCRYENVCKWSVEIQDSWNMYTHAYANIHQYTDYIHIVYIYKHVLLFWCVFFIVLWTKVEKAGHLDDL